MAASNFGLYFDTAGILDHRTEGDQHTTQGIVQVSRRALANRFREHANSILPEPLEPTRVKLCVADGVLNVLVPKVELQ